ncbi:MAG: T9SS type A sorting domain-containing protein [Saprospiraceae bacterium]
MTPFKSNILSQSINYAFLILKPFKCFLIFNLMLLFMPLPINAQTDTLICDNGGFEADFDYYFGLYASYHHGSNDCTPVDFYDDPVVWSTSSLPEFRRFEIVSSGTDPLVNIAMTKFGDKSLLLNNRYGRGTDPCETNYDISKIIKRFKVTAENREFTVWYAAVLENPSGHQNSQPYFSITCNLAPFSDLCFDASILNCEESRDDNLCDFDPIDSVNWACHKVKIPLDMVGEIATLEITAADCGQGCHFGYAYIDGICEECTGSIFGTSTIHDIPFNSNGLGIKYLSCNGDTIRICGSYTLPTICGDWELDHLDVPGFSYYNVTIDEFSQIFCFDLLISEFSEVECRELFVALYFKSNTAYLPPIFSNTIEICSGDYIEYEADITTGICQDNGTDDLLSDDYYYVSIDLSVNYGDFWTMERQLDDPYSGESGEYIIKTGTGSGTIDLGPILIQEGNWDLTINIGGCILFYEITAPAFCSGCMKFRGMKISDVTCYNVDPSDTDPTNDTWKFSIYIPGMIGQSFKINGVSKAYNSLHVMGPYDIEPTCLEFTLVDENNPLNPCSATFIVCPPKPCSAECDLEAYVTEVYCDEENEVEVFYVDLEVSGAGMDYYCYETFPDSYTTSNPFGPFTEDVYIIVYVCPSSECTCDKTCFKIIYVPKPDCDNLEFHSKGINDSKIKPIDELFVVPNPVNDNEIVLRSSMETISFEIYNSSGKLIHHGSFTGPEYKYRSEISPGLYFVRYKNSEGKFKYIKVIKL